MVPWVIRNEAFTWKSNFNNTSYENESNLTNLKWTGIQNKDFSFPIPRINIVSSPIKWSSDVQISLAHEKIQLVVSFPCSCSYLFTSSSSSWRLLWVPSSSTNTAACLMGHTRNTSDFLGWNWTFKIGDGKRYFLVHSPVSTSHIATVLSVEALRIPWPLLDQLQNKKCTLKEGEIWFKYHPYQREQTGWTWALIILEIPLVKKSHITILPSLHPTASKVPRLLKVHVTAIEMQSRAPSNSYSNWTKY